MYHANLDLGIKKKKKVVSTYPAVAASAGIAIRDRVQGSGCRVQGAGFRVQGAGCGVQGSKGRYVGLPLGGLPRFRRPPRFLGVT